MTGWIQYIETIKHKYPSEVKKAYEFIGAGQLYYGRKICQALRELMKRKEI